MIGMPRSNVFAFVLAALAGPGFLAACATANGSADGRAPADGEAPAGSNGGRYEVVVPTFERTGDARADFGEDAAERLRGMIDDLATHRPVPTSDVEALLRRNELSMGELNCVLTRQLTTQLGAEVAACISYEPAGGNDVRVSASFVDVGSGEAFDIEPFTIGQGDDREAAQRIFDAFSGFVEQQRASIFCREYASSDLWDDAETQCLRSIELNPEAEASLYTLARVYMEQERFEESLETLEQLLEVNPSHENGLQTAGYVAAQLGRAEEARDYYASYLQWNPENERVRIQVAYDLAQAGDPVGALQLIEEGIELDPDHIDFYSYRGNFAFSAAEDARREADSDEIPAEVEELYRTALNSYERLLDADTVEVAPSQLRNAAAAYLQLEEPEEAVRFARRALDEHPEEASLWSIYAQALRDTGEISDALAALDSLQRVDPDYANTTARQARWLLDEGQVDRAISLFREAVERGEQSADAIANTLFSNAHSEGVRRDNYQYAIRLIQEAKRFDVSSEVREQLDFWHAYSLMQRGIRIQEPETANSARQALPLFREARQLFNRAATYARENGYNVGQMIDATEQYIEIQEALIERGR